MPSIRKLRQNAEVGIAHYGLMANPTDPAAVAAAKKAASPPMTETQLVKKPCAKCWTTSA